MSWTKDRKHGMIKHNKHMRIHYKECQRKRAEHATQYKAVIFLKYNLIFKCALDTTLRKLKSMLSCKVTAVGLSCEKKLG